MSPSCLKIVLLSGNHLCHNPRVLKEADALHEAGWRIEVLGGWLDRGLAERDRELLARRAWKFTPVVDLTARASPGRRQQLRVRAKIGRLLGTWVGLENQWQLGYTGPELLAAVRQSDADLVIAHSEPGMWAVSRMEQSGVEVGVDMEDWFSEDLLPAARRGRPVRLLRSLERRLLRNGRHRTCTSRAMSEALAREFECSPPAVVHNTFPWSDRLSFDGQRSDRRNPELPSLHWFSQTIGPGRGLEDLFMALPFVKADLEIHLRGHLDAVGAAWLQSLLPERWRTNVFIHPLVTNVALLSRIAEHDLGFAGEMKYCRSRDLTITNKLFQYLLGGLAVLASDTAGQREAAALAPGAVSVYPSGDAHALAAALNRLATNPQALQQAKAMALRAAEHEFCWEKSSAALLGSVRAALSEPQSCQLTKLHTSNS